MQQRYKYHASKLCPFRNRIMWIPASPHRWHWRDGSHRQFLPSFEDWCRDFGAGLSARTSACCGSESISPRGCTHPSVSSFKSGWCKSDIGDYFSLQALFWQKLVTLKKKEQLTLSFSVPKMLAKYSAILLAHLATSEISDTEHKFKKKYESWQI